MTQQTFENVPIVLDITLKNYLMDNFIKQSLSMPMCNRILKSEPNLGKNDRYEKLFI